MLEPTFYADTVYSMIRSTDSVMNETCLIVFQMSSVKTEDHLNLVYSDSVLYSKLLVIPTSFWRYVELSSD